MKLCSYSEGETINAIPEIRLLLLHFSPNESTSVVIALQIWWLIPRRTRVSQYLQYLRIRLVEIFETITLARDLVQNRVTGSSLTPPCCIIGSSEKHQAPQETTLKALALAARAKIFQHLYLFQSAEVVQISTQLHRLLGSCRCLLAWLSFVVGYLLCVWNIWYWFDTHIDMSIAAHIAMM